jgi:hypothetical protein
LVNLVVRSKNWTSDADNFHWLRKVRADIA